MRRRLGCAWVGNTDLRLMQPAGAKRQADGAPVASADPDRIAVPPSLDGLRSTGPVFYRDMKVQGSSPKRNDLCLALLEELRNPAVMEHWGILAPVPGSPGLYRIAAHGGLRPFLAQFCGILDRADRGRIAIDLREWWRGVLSDPEDHDVKTCDLTEFFFEPGQMILRTDKALPPEVVDPVMVHFARTRVMQEGRGYLVVGKVQYDVAADAGQGEPSPIRCEADLVRCVEAAIREETDKAKTAGADTAEEGVWGSNRMQEYDGSMIANAPPENSSRRQVPIPVPRDMDDPEGAKPASRLARFMNCAVLQRTLQLCSFVAVQVMFVFGGGEDSDQPAHSDFPQENTTTIEHFHFPPLGAWIPLDDKASLIVYEYSQLLILFDRKFSASHPNAPLHKRQLLVWQAFATSLAIFFSEEKLTEMFDLQFDAAGRVVIQASGPYPRLPLRRLELEPSSVILWVGPFAHSGAKQESSGSAGHFTRRRLQLYVRTPYSEIKEGTVPEFHVIVNAACSASGRIDQEYLKYLRDTFGYNHYSV